MVALSPFFQQFQIKNLSKIFFYFTDPAATDLALEWVGQGQPGHGDF